MVSDSRRLSILTDREADDLYGLPRFTEEDRDLYFDLSPAERELVDGVFTISVAVHLVLQLGYFKAKRQFFVYALDAVTEDAGHILRRYFPARDMVEIKSPSRSTRLEQQQCILKLFDYRSCDAAAKEELGRKAQRIAMLSTQPVFILREVLQHLIHQRIVAPGYTYLQDMVGRTVSSERLRVTSLLGRALTPEVERRLEELLEADEGMYRISVLKHEPKDFSYGELRQESERRKFFQPLFEFGQTFLASAGIPAQAAQAAEAGGGDFFTNFFTDSEPVGAYGQDLGYMSVNGSYDASGNFVINDPAVNPVTVVDVTASASSSGCASTNEMCTDPSSGVSYANPNAAPGMQQDYTAYALAATAAKAVVGIANAVGSSAAADTAGNAIADVAPRALTDADLGLQPGSLQQLSGTYSVTNGTATAQIDMIQGTVSNPFGVIGNLSSTAQADGAQMLNIQGTLANQRLYNVLAGRYGLTSQGSLDTISIQLGNGAP